MSAALVRRLLFLAGTLLAAGGCRSGADPTAEKMLLQNVGKASVTVFPAFLRGHGSYDEKAAAQLAEFLNTAELAQATVSDRRVPITGPWRKNQARMWRDSAKEFGEFVRTNPIGTSFALLPEYLGGKDEAVGIHAYVVDAEGRLALQVLLNSHWEEFAKASPLKTADDCTAVLIDVLRNRLKPYAGQKP